jgi:dienelactone hydrolase
MQTHAQVSARNFVGLLALAGQITIGLPLLAGFACTREQRSSDDPVSTRPDEPSKPYLARRSAHVTQLRERGPSPGKYVELQPPPGVMEVTYPSGELQLQAWLARPLEGLGGYARPVLVYFHGDFAFGADDFEVLRAFVEIGFVVMTPMLRGENGNPGDFELLWGEIDDARAAIDWVVQQPNVDRTRVYAFGHSIGGGIAAMLTLYPELPLRRTGSCGGIYMPETFARWEQSETNADLVRFDPHDIDEIELRVLGPNVAWMIHPHIAYVGREDPWFIDNGTSVRDQAWAQGKPFDMIVVEGDHMASLAPALGAFLELARHDAPRF